MKFAQFWSSPWISWAIWMNKFLSGEFRVFHRKMVIIGFGHYHGNLAVKIKFDQMKFVLFMVMGIDWVASLLGEMVQNSCHILQSFRVG